MNSIGVQELADVLGWNRKKVCDWARRGLIATDKPTGTHGGPGQGYRFEKTSALDEFIREHGINTLADDTKLCADRIGTVHPDRFDEVVKQLARFGDLADKKLRTLINRRGFSIHQATQLEKALSPILSTAFLLQELNRRLGERITAAEKKLKKAKLARAVFSATGEIIAARRGHATSIRKALMTQGRKYS